MRVRLFPMLIRWGLPIVVVLGVAAADVLMRKAPVPPRADLEVAVAAPPATAARPAPSPPQAEPTDVEARPRPAPSPPPPDNDTPEPPLVPPLDVPVWVGGPHTVQVNTSEGHLYVDVLVEGEDTRIIVGDEAGPRQDVGGLGPLRREALWLGGPHTVQANLTGRTVWVDLDPAGPGIVLATEDVELDSRVLMATGQATVRERLWLDGPHRLQVNGTGGFVYVALDPTAPDVEAGNETGPIVSGSTGPTIIASLVSVGGDHTLRANASGGFVFVDVDVPNATLRAGNESGTWVEASPGLVQPSVATGGAHDVEVGAGGTHAFADVDEERPAAEASVAGQTVSTPSPGTPGDQDGDPASEGTEDGEATGETQGGT